MTMQYLIPAAAMPTTAALGVIATGTAIKTLIQFKPLIPCKLIEWGISFDGFAAALPGKVELVDTGTVAATVTALANADITKYNAAAREFGDPTSALIDVGTAKTGFNASAEGTITATQMYDAQLLPPTQPYFKQWPLGREPELKASNFIRIRASFGTGVNAYPYMIVEY